MSDTDKRESSDNQSEKQEKFKTSPKLYFYIGGLAGLLVFIGISAWWDLTFGAFDFKSFIADTLILFAIALATMVLSDLLSQETNMNRIFGVFNIARNDYDKIYKSVSGILVYFSQWYFWFLGVETRKKREGYLVLHGFEGTEAKKIVAHASIDDLSKIKMAEKYWVKETFDGKKIPFKKIDTEEQYRAAVSVLKGEQDVKNSAYSVYLFTDDKAEINMSVLERQEFLEKRRKQSKKKAYIMRIVMIALTALLMAALVPADDAEGEASKNRWWLLLKRVSVFVTSFISGWLAGNTDVSANAAKVRDKTSVLTTFRECYVKKLWQPKTQEQLDDEAIAEWEKEREDEKESVVIPDQVPMIERELPSI